MSVADVSAAPASRSGATYGRVPYSGGVIEGHFRPSATVLVAAAARPKSVMTGRKPLGDRGARRTLSHFRSR